MTLANTFVSVSVFGCQNEDGAQGGDGGGQLGLEDGLCPRREVGQWLATDAAGATWLSAGVGF
jgi:hypothetical protein